MMLCGLGVVVMITAGEEIVRGRRRPYGGVAQKESGVFGPWRLQVQVLEEAPLIGRHASGGLAEKKEFIAGHCELPSP